MVKRQSSVVTSLNLKLTVLFLICSAVLYGCASARVTMLTPAYTPKDVNANIDIYQTKPPEKKYKEIALIKCGDTRDDRNLKQILLKAREIGADGIILVGRVGTQSFGPMSGAVVGNIFFGSGLSIGRGYGLEAVAIKYIEE